MNPVGKDRLSADGVALLEWVRLPTRIYFRFT